MQAYYLHELLMQGEGSNWGIVGLGIMPFDKKMCDTLTEQDYLYTLISRGSTGFGCSVVGSIMDFVYATDQPSLALDRLLADQCKIVSLTVRGAACFSDGVVFGSRSEARRKESRSHGETAPLTKPILSLGIPHERFVSCLVFASLATALYQLLASATIRIPALCVLIGGVRLTSHAMS